MKIQTIKEFNTVSTKQLIFGLEFIKIQNLNSVLTYQTNGFYLSLKLYLILMQENSQIVSLKIFSHFTTFWTAFLLTMALVSMDSRHHLNPSS